MISIKQKNRRFLKIYAIVIFSVFTITQTAGTAFSAGLLPGFYGSSSSDIIAPQINSLPSLRNIVQGVSSLEYIDDNQLIIHQNEKNAIIDWDSFDIGVNAWTHFEQQNDGTWKILNRIYDQDPSLIYGRLTSDGQVYLINQNGLFFSPGSKVNVGSLVASSLNISDSDFLEGTKSFKRENYINPGSLLSDNGVVSNHGTIKVDDLGSVYLLGTCVENNGEISAYLGWVALAAGSNVDIYQEESNDILENVVNVQDGGNVYNYNDGLIKADLGQAGMYGANVLQNGEIRSVTAVRKNGIIELLASDKIILGEDSVTSSPISTSTEKVHNSFPFGGGRIDISGLNDDESPERVEVYGTIEAPSGTVNIDANERIYLEADSKIDASGAWSSKSVGEKILLIQLNSVELKDDYGQKDGILKGETITVSALTGSSIGDISGYISAEEKTALELGSDGGLIKLNAGSGDIIFKEGALLDTSGGGIEYTGGAVNTTKLLSVNNIVYDISDAPQWETYEKIINKFEKTYTRYGITETYDGISYGGVAPLQNTATGFLEGSNAGEIRLIGSSMVLEGTIDASVTKGINQTYYPTGVDDDIYQEIGLLVPTAGILEIGFQDTASNYYVFDPITKDIVIKSDSAMEYLSEDFTSTDLFPAEHDGTTYVSSSLINNAGLDTIEFYSRSGLTIEKDADIKLTSGGTFSAVARNILHEGSITVPGGAVSMILRSNVTSDEFLINGGNRPNPDYVSLEDVGNERIFLASESSISVAGEKIDNTDYDSSSYYYKTGLLEGGNVLLSDRTLYGEGIVLQDESVIDVSSGYMIDNKGSFSGDHAGALEIQGISIIIDGDLYGYSTVGYGGGSISLHAGSVYVLPSGHANISSISSPVEEIPLENQNKLIVEDKFLSNSGFTDITLIALDKIEIAADSVLQPSPVKISYEPENANRRDSENSISPQYATDPGITLISPSDELLGDSSISLKADEEFSGEVFPQLENLTWGVTIQKGAKISVWAEGNIDVSGREVTLEGIIEAQGGDVDIDAYDLTLASGSIISVKGYILRETDTLVDGLSANFVASDGGSVSLTASLGNIILEDGSIINVSGSEAVTNAVWGTDGNLTSIVEAGNSGSLFLTFFDDLIIEGTLLAETELGGLTGGSLYLNKQNTGESFSLSQNQITPFLSSGFDSLYIKSPKEISFTESMNIITGRDLIIDAPLISASSKSDIFIDSPWVTLTNTWDYYKGMTEGTDGNSTLTIQSQEVDFTGYITLSSFLTTNVISENDIRLNDVYYNRTTGRVARWGGINQTGDLTLDADRIYPETLSSFTIKSSGNLYIYDSGEKDASGSIYSSGSTLLLEASNIYHYGNIYAPLGTIELNATSENGRIYLGEESTLSTYTDSRINYGLLDTEGIFWGLPSDSGSIDEESPVENAPVGSISLNAYEVLSVEGSEIDVSGGGEIFAYQFLPGTDGSNDPFDNKNLVIILPDNSVYNPGKTIMVNENEFLGNGEYYILNEEYAFVPGAVVLEYLGEDFNPTEYNTTEEGYSVVSGKSAVAGSDYIECDTGYYSIRTAESLLQDGYFEIAELSAGDGGNVSIKGTSTILEGSIYGAPVNEEFNGGTLELSGKNILINSSSLQSDPILSNFDPFIDTLSEYYSEKLILSDEAISGRGMGKVILGDAESTISLVVEENVNLELKSLELNAYESITLNSNSTVEALSENGDGNIVFNIPSGTLNVGQDTLIHASDNIELNTDSFNINGILQADNSTISILSSTIYFISDEDTDRSLDAAYITPSLWNYLSMSEDIILGQGAEILFKESFTLDVEASLTIDASIIKSSGVDINISSDNVILINTGDTVEPSEDTGDASLSIDSERLLLSGGDIAFEGFGQINLAGREEIIFQSNGVVNTGDADIILTAPAVISGIIKKDDSYEVMDYLINAGSGIVYLTSNNSTYNNTAAAGGSFSINAESIIQNGILDMPGSYISYYAGGDDEGSGIFLNEGAIINAAGSDYFSGGFVTLSSERGKINVAQGSEINVSAGSEGNSGAIKIKSESNPVIIEGALNGKSEVGKGGSFYLDSREISDLGKISDTLEDGGFNDEIKIRSRRGDLSLEVDESITASNVVLSADGKDGNGNIRISGVINETDSGESSSIEFYANNELIIDTGIIKTVSPESSILLSGKQGIIFGTDAEIDMADAEDGKQSVVFRSYRTGDTLDIDLKGSVHGADTISVESFKTNVVLSNTDNTSVVNNDLINLVKNETALYMSGAGDLKDDLFNGLNISDGTDLYLSPGVELVTENNMSVKQAWDLTNWRYDTDNDGYAETAGSLILRAGENLSIKADIKDSPTNRSNLWDETIDVTSWDIGLSSGSDLTAANPLDVKKTNNSGYLTLYDGVLIYTERGNVKFSSAGDTIINKVDINKIVSASSVGFNIGTFKGYIKGKVGKSLILNGGAIQTSTGPIDLLVGADLNLNRKDGYIGTIRSFGIPSSSDLSDYISYNPGGSINITVFGDISGEPAKGDPWDAIYTTYEIDESGNVIFGEEWGAAYEGLNGKKTAQGIVAMAGGDISIYAAGDIAAAVGIFGDGDLNIFSGGDLDGRFLINKGSGNLYASNNFGYSAAIPNQQIELFDAKVSLTAGGNIKIGSIVNPTFANNTIDISNWNLTYSTDSSASISALNGDVIMTGKSYFYENSGNGDRRTTLPASMIIQAGKEIMFESGFIMSPSATGELILKAGNDIQGADIGTSRATIYMSDLDPESVYGYKSDELESAGDITKLFNEMKSGHSPNVLHGSDDNSILIEAGRDIYNIAFYLPKKVDLIAGRDIVDIYYEGQNSSSGDISLITAGNNIFFSTDLLESFSTGIQHGGPGTLIVKAGSSIDLGTTEGIQLVGNQINPYLSDDDNDLILTSGIEKELTLEELKEFFNDLQISGAEYSELISSGDIEEAENVADTTREEIIRPLIGEENLDDIFDLNMVESQINITGGSGGIYMMVMGEINVGKTTFKESGSAESDVGIYTASGGSVNIFSTGDLNVNESRVMTFAGGDITAWSDGGSINAGRGSKTSVNASKSEAVYDEDSGTWSIVFEAPAVGSGIRTLTFDPDGLEGPEEEPLPGDVYLFAPEGEIDAGEAGISGANVILGATEILNAQNISFSQGSVGVPVQTTSVNLGSLAGTSSLTDTAGMAEDATSSIANARDEAMQEAMKAMEDFIAKWLNVEVIGFYAEKDDEES